MSNRHIRKEPDITDRQRSLTDFEHVLLGQIALGPESGYGLKKTFSTTPLGVYQSSPGALYPALRRLVSRGLLAVDDVTPGRSAPDQPGEPKKADRGRAQKIYRTTEQGRAVFRSWLREPVDPETVGNDLDLHIMRFALMEDELPRRETRAFLADLGQALERFVSGLELYLASGAAPANAHARLSIEHGIAMRRASLDWTRHALRTLSLGGEIPSGAGRT